MSQNGKNSSVHFSFIFTLASYDVFVFVSFMLSLLGDFQVVVAVLGCYFPKDYAKKYRK